MGNRISARSGRFRSSAKTNTRGAHSQRVMRPTRTTFQRRAQRFGSDRRSDPDAYLWKPRSAFSPDRTALDTVSPGEVEESGETFAPESRRYLFEVGAVGDSEYELTLTGGVPMQPPEVLAALFPQVKQTPPHPLTVSDPLSAGQVGPAVPPSPYQFYLPMILMSH